MKSFYAPFLILIIFSQVLIASEPEELKEIKFSQALVASEPEKIEKEVKSLPILKVAAQDGKSPDLVEYPYVYYGRSKLKAEEGEYDLRKKFYVRIEFLQCQNKKYLLYLELCRSAHARLHKVMTSLGKESLIVKAISSVESQLRSATLSYSTDKISCLTEQNQLLDIVKFKRILKYKYLELIRTFGRELSAVSSQFEQLLSDLEEKKSVLIPEMKSTEAIIELTLDHSEEVNETQSHEVL